MNVGGVLLFSARLSVRPSARLSVRCRGNSNLIVFNRVSSKLLIWIASVKLSFKFEYGFSPTKDNQDGRQNGRRISVSSVVVTLTYSL